MKSILVVDDNEAIRDTLSVLLHQAGYQVIVASSAEEALEFCEETHFDLTICDLRMPVGRNENETLDGGITAIFEIKSRFPATPVIAMSGDLTERAIQLTRRFGVDDAVSKPFHTDRFLATVASSMSPGALRRG